MNQKSFKSIGTIATIVGFLCFLFFSEEKTMETFMYTMLISFLYSFVLGMGNGIVNNYLNKMFSWTEQTKKRTIVGIIATVLLNVILVYVCNYINFILIQGEDPQNFWNGKMNFRNWFFLNITLLISAFLHAKSFMQEWKQVSSSKIVEQKLIAKSADARFESLKNQLDPHFLFNSLNVLDALIEENPGQAQKFTTDLSKVYRYVLEQKDKELVTVEEELNFAKTYSNLLQIRFEDSVKILFDVEEQFLHKYIAPLSLQLLLENAIKHNFATDKKPLFIRISVQNDKLTVENNLQKREILHNESAGIGLANIAQRYALLTQSANVSIETDDEHFKVKIPLLNEKYINMNTPQTNNEALAYDRASKRVKELKGFYANLISYCLIIPFLVVLNLYTSPEVHWFWWPLLGWGLGLTSHGLQVFGVAKNWENRKIKELMEKEKNEFSNFKNS